MNAEMAGGKAILTVRTSKLAGCAVLSCVIYIYHDHPLRLPWPSIATATATANHIIP